MDTPFSTHLASSASVSITHVQFYLWPRISMPFLFRRLVNCSSLLACHQSLLASVSSSRDISKFIIKTSLSSSLRQWMEDVWLRDPTSKHQLPPVRFGIVFHFLGLDLLGYWLWHFYHTSFLFLPFFLFFFTLLYICLWFVFLYCPLASHRQFYLFLFF